MDISKQDKIAIVEENLRQIGRNIYNAVIGKRVADKVGDTAMAEVNVKNLTKFEVMKDELETILKELRK